MCHRLHKNGFITEGMVEQQFCPKCNIALADRYIEGQCPTCKELGARGDQCDKCGRLVTPGELINPHCKVN